MHAQLRHTLCDPMESMGFFRKDWSGLSFPSTGDLPNPEIELGPPALQVDSLHSEPPKKPVCFYSTPILL